MTDRLKLLVILGNAWLLTGQALGQFAVTINVPPDTSPPGIGSSTRLNLNDGGELPAVFQAGLSDGTSVNVEVNINGGFVGGGLRANGGSVVNIHGGTFATGLDSSFRANAGSEVIIDGGRVGSISALAGSDVTLAGGAFVAPLYTASGSALRIVGNEFRRNGELIAGLENVGDSVPLNTQFLSFVSGTLADGTPFGFGDLKYDDLYNGTVTLEAAELPPIGALEIRVPTDPAPYGIRDAQTLILDDGGSIESSFIAGWGSSVQIVGGTMGNSFQAIGANVVMSGGTIGSSSRLIQGSKMTMSGGAIGEVFTVHQGSALHISGGRVALGLTVEQGAHLEISGGAGFDGLNLEDDESSMTLIGGDFRLNGVPLANPELQTVGGTVSFTIPFGSALSGVLADGTPFSMGGWGTYSPQIPQILQAAPLPPIGPAEINATNDFVPLGIREGQTLFVGSDAAVGDYFEAGRDSKVVIAGGAIGKGLDALHAEIILSSGSIGGLASIGQGSELRMSGGIITAPPPNYFGPPTLSFSADSHLAISGGLVDGKVNAHGLLDLFGGEIRGPLLARSGGVVRIYGTHFTLDGADITASLEQNIPFTITQRGVSLAGELADGSSFHFALNADSPNDAVDEFDPSALLSIILVLPGDYNLDGVVGAADYTIWRNTLGNNVVAGTYADGNFDGDVSYADYEIWKNNFGKRRESGGSSASSSQSVSEPTAVLISCVLFTGMTIVQIRSRNQCKLRRSDSISQC